MWKLYVNLFLFYPLFMIIPKYGHDFFRSLKMEKHPSSNCLEFQIKEDYSRPT